MHPPLEGDSTDPNTPGVKGTNTVGIAIEAAAVNDTAVFAHSVTGRGIDARSGTDGIRGLGIAIEATAVNDTAVFAHSVTGRGIDARSGTDGIQGLGIAIAAAAVNDTAVFAHSVTGRGIDARSGTDGIQGLGIAIEATAVNDTAVFAHSTGGLGVDGRSSSPTGSGVVGTNNAFERGDEANGVLGFCVSPNGNTAGGNAIHGVGGTNAGLFDGHVQINGGLDVTGELTCPNKHFRIDHPCDPENKYLLHCSVEAPEMINVYSGNVITGEAATATVFLPNYFEALNCDFRYQLTPIGQFCQAIVAEEIANNRFVIKTDRPQVKVSWQVSGVRKDVYAKANPLVVENEKSAAEKASYLRPRLDGHLADKAPDPPDARGLT